MNFRALLLVMAGYLCGALSVYGTWKHLNWSFPVVTVAMLVLGVMTRRATSRQ